MSSCLYSTIYNSELKSLFQQFKFFMFIRKCSELLFFTRTYSSILSSKTSYLCWLPNEMNHCILHRITNRDYFQTPARTITGTSSQCATARPLKKLFVWRFEKQKQFSSNLNSYVSKWDASASTSILQSKQLRQSDTKSTRENILKFSCCEPKSKRCQVPTIS